MEFCPALRFLQGNQENEGSRLSLSSSPKEELGVPLWGSWGVGGEVCLCAGYGPGDL